MSGGRGGGATGVATLKVAVAAAVLLAIVALTPFIARAAVGDTTLVSRGAADAPAPANGDSGPGLAVSADGRYIAFESKAANLSAAAQPGVTNIYMRDTQTGTITLVSRVTGADGAGADGDSAAPTISPAGRFVAFDSVADNLSAADDNNVRNVFVRDTITDTTTLVSQAPNGSAANGDSSHPSISKNGTVIAFDSTAHNLTLDDTKTFTDVYAKNMETGEISLVSRPFGGVANGNSYAPTIDKEGLRVAYTSDADNLSTKDNNTYTNVFVTDLQTKFTFAVSLPTGGFLKQDPSDGDSWDGVISADGRYVAFVSYANNFVDEPIRTPQIADVFRRDIQASKTELVSRATGLDGGPALASSAHPSISIDGRFVAFESAAGNLSTEDTADSDVFVRNVEDGVTTLVDRATGGTGVVGDGGSYAPALSRDGRFVAFSSDATNLSADDDHTVRDVFVRQVPVGSPKPDAGPDLGSNDHSAHEGHTAAEHAGHTAAEHAGHVTATGGPAMTLFGPPVQAVDKLYMLAQVHADAKLIVTASVKLPGGTGASRLYRFKSFSGSGPAHKIYRVKLKLPKSQLRVVKRALKRGKKLKAKIVGKAQNAAGGPWTTVTRTVRLRG